MPTNCANYRTIRGRNYPILHASATQGTTVAATLVAAPAAGKQILVLAGNVYALTAARDGSLIGGSTPLLLNAGTANPAMLPVSADVPYVCAAATALTCNSTAAANSSIWFVSYIVADVVELD